MLYYLIQRAGAVDLPTLVGHLANWEGMPTSTHREQVRTALVHVHLPKLAEAGVIDYDPISDMVELEAAADLTRYLGLAAADDLF